MKRVIAKALKVSIILVFVSCASFKGIHLIDLATKESPSETALILTTSKPVQYEDTKLENPPALIISFPENKVFSNEEEEVIINKGPIKKIKNEYYESAVKGQHRLNLVIVELIQDTPYTISNSGSSIIIKMENPKPSPVTPEEEITKIEAQPHVKEEIPHLEPGYLIGPEDVLSIEVWNHPDLSGDVRVNYRGEIRVPPVRKISIMGLTVDQLEEKLAEAFSKYLIDPVVFVTVKEYNSQRVIALGETTTGMYTLKRKTTLLEFLGQIGGTTENADIYHIRLIKKDGKAFIYDLNKLIKDPQKNAEVLVSGGDKLYVPPLENNRVFVLGEVKSPQIINIKGQLRLVDAITQAGGYTQDAVLKSIVVIRGELGSQKAIRVNLKQILKKGDIGQNIELMPGDIVYVPKTFIVDLERLLRDLAFPIAWYFWYLRY